MRKSRGVKLNDENNLKQFSYLIERYSESIILNKLNQFNMSNGEVSSVSEKVEFVSTSNMSDSTCNFNKKSNDEKKEFSQNKCEIKCMENFF